MDGEAYQIDEVVVEIVLKKTIADNPEETHECEECAEEFDGEHHVATHKGFIDSNDMKDESNIEEPTMTESTTNDTSAEAKADGGTEEIHAYHEVQHSGDRVRSYSADGHLYAYREGNEHVVVSRGNEPQTCWTKRVPAERNAILAGERLWTIPENWEHRVTINGPAEALDAIYHIPGTGVDVFVTVPYDDHLVDAWYGVKRIGKLSVTYDDEINWDELSNTIESARDIEKVSDDVIEALETLYHFRHSVERKLAEAVDMYAEEELFKDAHEPIPVRDGTAEPWGGTFNISDIVEYFLNLDYETTDAVLRKLYNANVVPHHPTVRVDVEEDQGVPESYDIRALVEADASGPETIDYLITEHYDVITQTDWAKVRGKGSSVIGKNVRGAKNKLLD